MLESLGFQNPNDTTAGKALYYAGQGYQDIMGQAGQTLGRNYTAPQMQVPQWQQANVLGANTAYARGQDASTSTMGAAQANVAGMRGAQLAADEQARSRAQQDQLVGNLFATAGGQGPSVAQEQLRQATAQNIAQQSAMAQSAHGGARLAALRNAQWTGAATQQQAASQAAGLRAGEIQQAQGQLGNVLGTSRQQDIGTAEQNAQLQQQAALANSGYAQQTALANAQLAQQAQAANMAALNQGSQFNASQANQLALANAQAQQQTSQFNAGAYNAATGQYTGAANQGNLAAGQSNLQAQLGTNQLNVQQGNAYLNALLGGQAGLTGVDTTMYQGQLGYDAAKRQMTGQMLGAAGGALSSLV